MTQNLSIQGVLKEIKPEESGTGLNGKQWRKRNFLVAYQDGKYDKVAQFSLLGDKIEIIDKFGVGEAITVWFAIDSRAHGVNWYTNLNAWKIAHGPAITSPPYNPPPEDDELT